MGLFSQKKPKRDYGQEEEDYLFKKSHGKVPPFFSIARVETRKAYQVPNLLHRKGQVVDYKHNIYVITEVQDKGIIIQELKNEGVSDKKVFISDRKILKGKIYPHYTFTT